MPRPHSPTPQKSKRQEFREMRKQREQRTRIITVAAIVIGALLIVTAFAGPTIRQALVPAPTARVFAEIKPITPVERPSPQGTALGDPNAPVRVDVWEDFQCPACVNYSNDVEHLVVQNYVATGQVYYVYHLFPFIDDASLTKESDQSANAAMCASEQGRFWDFHDILIANWDGENEGAFADSRLIKMAETLELDMTAFNACFTANRYSKEINNDLKEGKAQGVQGTPSVFVNGILLKPGYVPSYEDVAAAIEAELKK
jgi:protein-disulfide isomerase